MESNSMNSLPNAMPFNCATSDSAAQTGGTNAGDWKEEVYQKIKTMKDTYYADINEMHQKISMKLQQHDSLPHPAKMEMLEKLRMFKAMLEKLMQILQTSKNNILPTHREKLLSFEKQIVGLLNINRPRRPVHPMQQGQVLPPQMQSLPLAQQPHSQISQAQSHESVPGSLQTNFSIDSGQGTAPSSMQQVAIPSLQQNCVSVPQQANICLLQSQSGVASLDSIAGGTNAGDWQEQVIKRFQECSFE